tara:strand:+ start:40828 stop:42495 length:1668 start_codon:yes stop_codon:yes gene_type:complete
VVEDVSIESEDIPMTAFTQTDIFSTAIEPEVLPFEDQAGEMAAGTGVVASGFIELMLAQYQAREKLIQETKDLIDNASSMGVLGYFADGFNMAHSGESRWNFALNIEHAKAALRAEYWGRLLNETDIFDMMPAAKREEARSQFFGLDSPPFEEATVRPTLTDLLAQRANWFAERVDGVFRTLSKSHFTNQPTGFCKKMILANVFDQFGYVETYQRERINDLRAVVGRILGRGEPDGSTTGRVLRSIYTNHLGKKVSIDNGAFIVTAYKAGTLHLEVAPEVAQELNEHLARLYPAAIPHATRKRKKERPIKNFNHENQALPFSVLRVIGEARFYTDSWIFSAGSLSKPERDLIVEVLESIGGEVLNSLPSGSMYIRFDYDAKPVLEYLARDGAVPEKVSHQFYSTADDLADRAEELLDLQDGDECLEPSAGTGKLAKRLPASTTTCVELARLRCQVLNAMGYKTVEADFLAWSRKNPSYRADRILMNPPFSKNRAQLHTEAALGHLNVGGRLVAVLPASMRESFKVDGFNFEWSEVLTDQFEGTSVRVVLLKAEHA